MKISKYLILCLLLCSPAYATVNVVRYPSGTPVAVCQASDSNPSCGGGGSGLTVGTTTIANGTNSYVLFDNNGKLGEWIAAYTNTSSSIVSRDSAGNSAFNNIILTTTSVAATGQTIALNYGSAGRQRATGTGNITYNMPDATTLYAGENFYFDNDSTGLMTIYEHDGTTLIGYVISGAYSVIINLTNGTTNGTWSQHYWIPQGGTSSQFVKGDGSLDSTTYLTSTTGLLSSGATTGATSQAQTFTDGIIPSNLTVGYVPYAESTDTKLVNSPIYTDGTNVGIGTTNPGQALEVVGNTLIPNGYYYMAKNSGGTALNVLGFGFGTDNLSIGSGSLNDIGFTWSEATNGLYLKSGGNVGIGTTNPGNLLEVNGIAQVDAGLGIGRSPDIADGYNLDMNGNIRIIGTTSSIFINNGSTQYNALNTTSGATPLLQLYNGAVNINSSGNVGIGTTTPGATLEVNGSLKTNLNTGSNAGTPVTMCTDSNGALCKCTQCA